jgi:thioredoxin-dependent peroxiredoxin
MPVSIGSSIPKTQNPIQSTQGELLNFESFRGKNLVLYFYPKNDTPGCTTETMDFVSHHNDFVQANTVVFGVSRDSLASHEAFRTKLGIPFNLISDPQEELCFIFDVMRNKMMYGKQVRGLERSTFVFDRMGDLAREWRGVKVDGHAADVLNFVHTL